MSIDTGQMQPTPTKNVSLPYRMELCATIADALEYAAQGETGFNFYSLRGELVDVLPYREICDEAQALARHLAGTFKRGDRLALVAETSRGFITTFFACQYAGLIPAPVPLPVNLGGKDGYLTQIRQMMVAADAAGAIGPETLKDFLREATEGLEAVTVLSFEEIKDQPLASEAPVALQADEPCYIQFSSGSTSAPKGVVGTQASVNANLLGITRDGLQLREDDRASSWLPLYHDMGLIGFCLAPLYGQTSVDYLATSDFVRRPLLWLRIMSQNKTTTTYSPSFGYELSARRAPRAEDGAIDLSSLRVAGIGGDMVRPEALQAFADAFADKGFDANAFLPSYGMAEATLALSFTKIGEPLEVDYVDMRHFNRSSIAQPASAITSEEHRRGFVLCGTALRDHAIAVRDSEGRDLPDRSVGRIFIKGPSLTPGYYGNDKATSDLYDGDWLDTGDMGYFLRGQIVITGRAKDLIIINGRNIWPQDIEWAVESLPGVRQSGVAAFSVDDGKGERIVAVVERRGRMSALELSELKRDVARMIQTAAGAPAEIVLARPHSMVMTSSGKLSRAKVKAKYLSGAFDEAIAEAEASSAQLAKARV